MKKSPLNSHKMPQKLKIPSQTVHNLENDDFTTNGANYSKNGKKDVQNRESSENMKKEQKNHQKWTKNAKSHQK